MKRTACDICESQQLPLNETIKIDNKVYCSQCFNKIFSDQRDLKGKLIEKEHDPTICSSCQRDFGAVELHKISVYPVCEECEISIKNKTFPLWVKGFFVAVIAIVIIGFIWNWKFYEAYHHIKLANKYAEKGDFANANLLMADASKKVPEVGELELLATYFHGIDLLSKDKSEEALNEFNKCKDKLPADYNLSYLIIDAKIGSAFDHKDYEGFLEASKERLSVDSSSATSFLSVASAYACLYAEKGADEEKQNALLYLQKSKSLNDTTKDTKEYYNMIEYRLDSRKIIKREEFIKQFPNGWTKN